MDDYTIKIGLDAKDSGGVAGTQGEKGEQAISGGVMSAIKGLGIVGILMSLKSVADVISIAMALVNVAIVSVVGFLGGLFGQFITKVVPFFDDPMRSLLQLGLFIVNGIISGIEFGLNMVVYAINLVISAINRLIPFESMQISPMESFELPRFQESIVLEAYDQYKSKMTELSEQGEVSAEDSFSAFDIFARGLEKSFMTGSEFQNYLQEKQIENQQSTIQATNSMESGIEEQQTFADVIEKGFKTSTTNFGDAFAEVDSMITEVNKWTENVKRSLGRQGSSTAFQSSGSARDEYERITRATTIMSEKQSKAGLYLLNKGIWG